MDRPMAQRDTNKAKRASAPRAAVASHRAVSNRVEAASDAGARIDGLLAEISSLKTQLAATEQKLAELESQRIEALNRIDWVVDSLHNLLDREG